MDGIGGYQGEKIEELTLNEKILEQLSYVGDSFFSGDLGILSQHLLSNSVELKEKNNLAAGVVSEIFLAQEIVQLQRDMTERE